MNPDVLSLSSMVVLPWSGVLAIRMAYRPGSGLRVGYRPGSDPLTSSFRLTSKHILL